MRSTRIATAKISRRPLLSFLRNPKVFSCTAVFVSVALLSTLSGFFVDNRPSELEETSVREVECNKVRVLVCVRYEDTVDPQKIL